MKEQQELQELLKDMSASSEVTDRKQIGRWTETHCCNTRLISLPRSTETRLINKTEQRMWIASKTWRM